ncbi:hypothetical protein GAP32_455 [Cronobacter phage vB_CsaM_GAP32]|uniref:Uncharacterized protein n=1 Tax=Cronobacter phage vB_CsaM_GAP32 TaxID=1141136 RepID=K4F7S8_9CAUD|nr:hypothetical protein GAP32_455 [Cronobacter phage vB_CsaM_GAP32]AFC21912.1 hypothetical protein GAP32_455 [Cronobacter phage vB_CsaM_GAP32]
MFSFLKQLFCNHYEKKEVCKIHYLPGITELIYSNICKECGKKLGKSTTKQVGTNEKE